MRNCQSGARVEKDGVDATCQSFCSFELGGDTSGGGVGHNSTIARGSGFVDEIKYVALLVE